MVAVLLVLFVLQANSYFIPDWVWVVSWIGFAIVVINQICEILNDKRRIKQ